MKDLIKKVGKLKPYKWVGKTAKQVFSRKNMNEYGIPVMTGFTLYAGLDAIGSIEGMFDALEISGTPKIALYGIIGPGSKVGCFAAMNYDKFINTNYKEIAKNLRKDFTNYLKKGFEDMPQENVIKSNSVLTNLR